jgi:hypothetical protein
MLNISRALTVLALAAFLTTGTALAQAPQAPQAPPMSAPQGQGAPKKCAQTPKGCHKNQSNGAKKKCGQTPKGCHKHQAAAPSGAAPPPQL